MAKELFLNILRCALKGELFRTEAEITEEVWAEIFELARLHKVLPLIYDSAYRLLEERNIDTSGVHSLSRQMMISQASKTSAFLSLLEKFKSQSIPLTVVKGIACRRLYKNPDLRISSDEDILLNESDLALCEEILINEGFTPTTPERHNHYQKSYRRADGIHIEAHRTLFPDNSTYYKKWNELFKNPEKELFRYDSSDLQISTLSPTYNLLYLILHAFKHFINVGVGIRQVCDIAMHSRTYQKEIDWEFAQQNLSRLNALSFAKAVFSLADERLGFELSEFLPLSLSTDTPSYEPLLQDILEGGVYGTATLSRAHSRSFTEKAAQGKKTTFLSRIFPAPQSLKGRYRYARNPVLLPVAYIHRLVNYSGEVIKNKDNGPVASAKIGARRIKLLKFYSVIEADSSSPPHD